jgi:hypothetical protein
MAMLESNAESRMDRRYTIAICKGAGLVDETRQLINHWRPGEEVKGFVRRVQEEDLLGRYTAYRARDIARRVFARRFLIPSDRPARILKRMVDRGLPHKTFTEMLFLFACRARGRNRRVECRGQRCPSVAESPRRRSRTPHYPATRERADFPDRSRDAAPLVSHAAHREPAP